MTTITAVIIMAITDDDDGSDNNGNDDVQDPYVLLIMVDADAPSPDYCPKRYWLQWMAQVKIEVGYVHCFRLLCCCFYCGGGGDGGDGGDGDGGGGDGSGDGGGGDAGRKYRTVS